MTKIKMNKKKSKSQTRLNNKWEGGEKKRQQETKKE